MKGFSEKENDRHTAISKCKTGKEQHDIHGLNDTYIKFTPLDLVPIDFNKESAMKYLVDSRWIESLVIMKLGDQCPYLDDYIQEIYLMIFEKLDRLIQIYEQAGIGAFIGYVKCIVTTNCFSSSGYPYKHIREFSEKRTVYSDELWSQIQDKYSGEEYGQIYKMTNTYDE